MAFETKTSEVKDHATFSASGAERWLNCPGSIKLAEKAPPAPESEYAAEGTAAHACLEFLLKNRWKLEAATKTARKKWDPDMVEHALFAVGWVLEKAAGLPGSEILSETRVDSTPFLKVPDQFGTLDVSIVQEFGRLVVIDYKYGAGHAVDPEGDGGEGNSQLVYYALALSYVYGHTFTEVELVIIQPRAYHESGDVVRSFVMSMDALLAWGPRFEAGALEAQAKAPGFASGPWCRWCQAATICPELKTKALKQAQVVFNDETGLESVPEPKLITLPNLTTILDACDRLDDWIGKVREHALHVLERGGDIPGFKLVAKRGIRKWKDEDEVSAEARERFGDMAFTTPRLLSPAQLEKAARTAKGVDEWVSARVTAESSGTTLVRESDKRPAVRPLEKVFADEPKTLPAALQGKIPSSGKRK
jgi:hypothetical protein